MQKPNNRYTEDFIKKHADQIINMTYADLKTQFNIPIGSANVIKQRCSQFLNVPLEKAKRGPKVEPKISRIITTSCVYCNNEFTYKYVTGTERRFCSCFCSNRYYATAKGREELSKKKAEPKVLKEKISSIDAYDELILKKGIDRASLPQVTNKHSINLVGRNKVKNA